MIFLDQLGADGGHPQIARACDYLLDWCPSNSGGFGASAVHKEAHPPPSAVIHCLNGNLLRALIGFGRLDDERVQTAIDSAARTITGEGVARWYASGTSGPGFACAANDHQPCAWGALKELSALARIPRRRRTPLVRRAIDAGAGFLFSRDRAVADYPMGWGDTKPNGSWFKPGFPIGYVSDVLQTLEVLADLGHGRDPRLARALTWVEAGQNAQGRWINRYAYNGKTWADIEHQGGLQMGHPARLHGAAGSVRIARRGVDGYWRGLRATRQPSAYGACRSHASTARAIRRTEHASPQRIGGERP